MDRPASHKRQQRSSRARVPLLAGTACYVLAAVFALTGELPADEKVPEGPATVPDPTVVLSTTVDVGRAEAIDQLGRFLEAHLREEVRLHVRWTHAATGFTATEGGRLSAAAPCHPRCGPDVRGAVEVTVTGLPAARHRFDGRGGTWWTTGGYVVERVEVAPDGGWSVGLRPSGARGEPGALAGDCAVAVTGALAFADPPTAEQVRLVQDALNARGYGCVSEDGVAGPETVEALRRFEQDNALEADGVLDEQAYRLLLSPRRAA